MYLKVLWYLIFCTTVPCLCVKLPL